MKDDFYIAPELVRTRLKGVVTGHPRKPDGKVIITTKVARVDGRVITTDSGTVYELVGEPSPEYVAYMAANRIVFDSEAPIKIRKWEEPQ